MPSAYARVTPAAPVLNPGFRLRDLPLFTLIAIVAAFVLWMLSMPCFPTTDGPVHMYYVHILSSLFAHNNADYAHYFRIRHVLPPYSLYYYTLLLLSKVMPMLTADRLIICFYFVSFVFGFRFLARQVGPSADITTLLVTPLLLNWPLGMGFVNFCLALSFSFWAAGLWLTFQGTRNLKRRVIFLLLVTGIMLTHPVPLLLLLTVTGSLLLARIVSGSRAAGRFQLPEQGGADLLTLGLATLNCGYVKLFTNANPLKQTAYNDEPGTTYWGERAEHLTMYVREHAVAFVYGRHLDTLVYRSALLIILFGAAVLAVQQRRRNHGNHRWAAGDTFLVLGIGLFLLVPFIPTQVNELFYVADRLVICVYLAFLLAASGWSGRWRGSGETDRADEVQVRASGSAPLGRWVLATAVFAIVADACLLHSADRNLRPTAEVIASLDQMPPTLQGQVGFLMEDARKPLGNVHEGVSWNPYYWAAVHTFRHNDAVMANAPWMHESVIPVAPAAALPEVSITALQEPVGVKLQRDLLRSPEDLRQALQADSFFIVNQVDRPALAAREPILAHGGAGSRDWNCALQGWYRLCRQTASGGLQSAQAQAASF